jgi:hypothetical protein
MDEEKLRILKMVEDGKISATDAVKLIEALEKTETRPSERELRKRWLHVKATKDGDRNVDVKIPLSLLKFGFKLAPHLGSGKYHRNAARHAERAQARAERAQEKAERLQERIEEKTERLRERLEERLGNGSHPEIEATIEEALAEARDQLDAAMKEAALAASRVEAGADGFTMNGVPGIPELGDLDLDKILEMAAHEDFDGKILEVHDDDDDEHVVITLE